MFKSCLVLFVSVVLSVTALADSGLKVGVAIPLTGDFAVYGAAVKNGFLLAEKEPSKGSQKVNFFFEDNQFDSAKTLAAVEALTSIHKIDLLYVWGEVPLSAVAAITARRGLPTYTMSVDPIPAQGRPSIARTINTPDDFVQPLIDWAVANKQTRVSIVVNEDPFMRSLTDAWKRLAPAKGVTVDELATVNPGEHDFRSIIQKARQQKVSALAVYLIPGQIEAFFKQAAVQRFRPAFFGTDCFESREVIAASGHAIQGGIYPNMTSSEEFRKRYRAAYQNEEQISYAYNAFVTARLILQHGNAPGKNLEEFPDVRWERSKGGEYTLRFPLELRRVTGEWVETVK